MRIAIVLNTSWNIWNFRMGLVKALQREGHHVITLAPHDSFSHLLEEAGTEYHALKMDSRGANPLKDALLIRELYLHYRRLKPDVVLHFTIKPNIYGTLAARMLGIPTVNNVCGLGTVFLKKGLVSRFAQFMYRMAFRFPDKVYFQNHHDLDLFLDRKLVPKSRVDLVPGSGINLGDFQPTAPKHKGPFTFLMVSRMIYDKGVLEYIQAADQLAKRGVTARFQMLGPLDPAHKRGIPTEELEAWMHQGTVDYLGTRADVREVVSQADAVVLPSYREGTPRTLLEAASMGKPLVATDVPGCNSVVKEGVNGFLCKSQNANDLAEKMWQLYATADEDRQRMGQRSRQLVEEQFDENIVINKYLQTLREVMD